MDFKWLVLPSIFLAITANIKADSGLKKANSSSYNRFKRYEYLNPQIWTHPYSSFYQDETNDYQQNREESEGHHYNKPETNGNEVNTNFIHADQRTKEYYETFISPTRNIEYQRYGEPYSRQHLRDHNNAREVLIVNPNDERELWSPSRGDELGASLSSDIFGRDTISQNYSISPTGLFLASGAGSGIAGGLGGGSGLAGGVGGGSGFAGGSGGGSSFSCTEPYQRPPTPDFRDAKRRISDVKCYEYIWELKIRDDMQKREMQCNNMRSKRSLNWDQQAWPQQSWYPQYESQHYDGQQTGWAQQYEPLYDQHRYDQSRRPSNGRDNFATTESTTTSGAGAGLAGGITFSPAEPEEFPHMAILGWRGVTQDYVFKCGGSLISNNFVLTAAHCTASAPDPTILDVVPRIVRIGDTNIGFRPDGQTFKEKRSRRQAKDPGRLDVGIEEILKYEQYKPEFRYYDIALLKLEYKLDFNKHLQPACLLTNPNIGGRIRRAVASGWGVVDLVTSRITADLQAGELDIIDTPTCNRLLRPLFGRKLSQIVDHQLCAGKLEGGSDVCQGDSGGPLQVKIKLPYKNQGSMHSILGIISAGAGCARPNTPGVYTRVTSFLDWIEGYVWPEGT